MPNTFTSLGLFIFPDNVLVLPGQLLRLRDTEFFCHFFCVCVNKRTRREFLSFVLRTVYFTLLGIGFMMMTMMPQKKTAGLAKDDEDVRVQSTNDEATGARACVCVVYFLFLDFFYPLLNVIAFSN